MASAFVVSVAAFSSVFFSALALALLYRIVADFLNKKIEERKKKGEEEKGNNKLNEKEKAEINEIININENKDEADSRDNRILENDN